MRRRLEANYQGELEWLGVQLAELRHECAEAARDRQRRERSLAKKRVHCLAGGPGRRARR